MAYRAWINQPSTLQPLHKLHGTRCIVVEQYFDSVRVCFTNGDIVAMDVPTLCLSKGWPIPPA
jgi:hypothetical protein